MIDNLSPYYLFLLTATLLSNALVAMLVAGVRNYEEANGQNNSRSNSAWWLLWRYLPLILVPVFTMYQFEMYRPELVVMVVSTLGALPFGNAVYRAVFNARLDTDPGMYYLGNRTSDRFYKGLGLFLGIDPGELAYSIEFGAVALTYGFCLGLAAC